MFFETSAKSSSNVEEAFVWLVKEITKRRNLKVLSRGLFSIFFFLLGESMQQFFFFFLRRFVNQIHLVCA